MPKKKKQAPIRIQLQLSAILAIILILTLVTWIAIQYFSRPNPLTYADAQHAMHEQAYQEARMLWEEQGLTNYRFTITFATLTENILQL